MQLAIQRMSMCRMRMRSDIFLASPFFYFLVLCVVAATADICAI